MTKLGDADWRSLEQFSFGDSPELADELAELVLAGKKRATCWAASEGPQTEIGKRMVMLDGSGVPRAVVETVELTQRRFGEVDDAFAFDEGEDDHTLASWRRAHRNYFGRQGTFSTDMLLYCERFRLASRIDPGASASGLSIAVSRSISGLRNPVDVMTDTGIAKIFMHGRSQAAHLPLAFRLPGDRVRVRRVERGIPVEPMVTDIDAWFVELYRFDYVPFMEEGRQQPPMPVAEDLFA